MGVFLLRCVFFIMMTLSLLLRTQAEFFTAIAHMESLLYTQKIIIDNLDDYIAKEEKRLAVLKKHLNCYKKEHNLAMREISDYLENPINTLILIKRLTKDLDFIVKNIVGCSDYVKNIIAKKPYVMYPTLEDLTGAIQALTRLQNTYRLDIEDLAEGRLIGRISRGTKDPVTSTPMAASDCYELGLTLYYEKDYHSSLRWMMEALRKLKEGDDLYNISEVDVLEYISFSYKMLGDIKSALEWTVKLLTLDSKHPRASGNVKIFQKVVDKKEQKIKQGRLAGEVVNEEGEQSQASISVKNEMMGTYEALCRGDIDIQREIKKKLKCSYLTTNHPFLKLAPIKMEQVYIGPDVFMFHEVISDEEIEHIKNIAKPIITRAVVDDPVSKKTITASYRTSKSAWLRDEDSEVVARITQRTADLTGFSMGTAESLQVTNYGIGGHYIPHFDYHNDDLFHYPGGGNRIATVLFYYFSTLWSCPLTKMSDVTQGGATVFIKLGLTVFPVKNSALFWNNLLPSGEGDDATLHAACPVLLGSKWASNKWIHVVGQELIKPCGIEFQHSSHSKYQHQRV